MSDSVTAKYPFTVNKWNRGLARKLVRQHTRMPSPTIYAMSYDALALELSKECQYVADKGGNAVGHHDTLVKRLEAYERVCREREAQPAPQPPSPAPVPEPAEPSPEPEPTPPPTEPATPRADRPKPGFGAGGILESLVGELVSREIDARGLKIDPAQIRAEVERIVATGALLPASVLTVKVADREAVKIEGIRHFMFEQVLKAFSAGEHVWLPGPAGSGKSTLVRQALEALGYKHGAKEKGLHMMGAIETPFQAIGYIAANGDRSPLYTPLRLAVEFGGGLIFDDVDRSNPKALATFNEGMANGYWSFPDGVIKQHETFLLGATANTFGLGGGADYVGAARLDKATLDRFTFIEIPYDESCEMQIAGRENFEWCRHVQKVRKAVVKLGLKHLVTPRATYRGIRLLAAGMSREQVEAATVYAGLDSATVMRIKGAL